MVYVWSTVSLVIQIVVLGLIVSAVSLKNKKKYRQHGIIMLSAVLLHLVSVLAVMGPSSAGFFSMPSSMNFADVSAMVAVIHVFTGLASVFLGIWLVGAWHLKEDMQGCFGKKRVMDVTLLLWLLAIALGAVLYLIIIRAF